MPRARPLPPGPPVPLSAQPHWAVSGVRDSTMFFEALSSLLPDATRLMLGGAAIAVDVRRSLTRHLELESTVIPDGYGWPTDWWFEIWYRYSRELLADLALLSERHAEPEICDRCRVSRHSEPLLEWFDAFDNQMAIAREVPELRVRLFCRRLGATFEARSPAG